ncbi:MAG: carbohydrate porin [Phycisphaerae bacterium]
MVKTTALKTLVVTCIASAVMQAGGWAKAAGPGTPEKHAAQPLSERETLTGDWWGLGDELAEQGITLGLSATQVYQFNVDGGLATHRHAGRFAGSYDLEGEFDLERLLNVPGGTFFFLAEGSWSDGLDASSVGSLMGLNDDAAGDRSIDVTEAWYEQCLADGRFRLRLGKIDLAGGFECRGCPVSFDGNSCANDETTQFLASPLVNNAAIPFPDNGIGAAAYWEPVDGWYLAAGVADAEADARETGFNTAFSGPERAVSIYETGAAVDLPCGERRLPGAYRVGFWINHYAEYLDGRGSTRDVPGLYVSLDQMVLKENADPEDGQGLGAFFRYARADEEIREVYRFWSGGFQYRGLIAGRDEDVLGFGFAHGRLAPDAGFTADHETIYEVYYSIRVAPRLAVSPHVQHVVNPGGDDSVEDATVVGVRIQASF